MHVSERIYIRVLPKRKSSGEGCMSGPLRPLKQQPEYRLIPRNFKISVWKPPMPPGSPMKLSPIKNHISFKWGMFFYY
jgi:hypothetical protein